MSPLNIPEKLFILTIDDHNSRIDVSIRTTLRYGLAGAVLAELALANRIELHDGRLALMDSGPAGNEFLEEFLAQIKSEKKPHKLSRWVDSFGRKQIVDQIAERLAEQRVITLENKKYLWIIPYDAYPQLDASAKYWLKQHLRGIVLAGEKSEPADIALLSLLRSCGFIRLLFTWDERRYANKKVKALVNGEIFGKAVAELLSEIDEAAAAAAVAAASAAIG